MLIVESDPVAVELSLSMGNLACPSCAGVLRPWGWARERVLREAGREQRLRVRRSRCRACATSHVLLPDACLLRRRDAVSTIVTALVAKAKKTATAAIASALGVPFDTVRRWLRRFAARAEELRVALWARAHVLDPELEPIVAQGTPFADAVEALGVAMRAAGRRLGPRPGFRWASALTGGLLLANTSCTFSAP